ncbi:MAG: hypothetical protein KAW89_06990 [Armatimonadetes bacterium]|nr:hypothetical protein [Armatimonadota bacterium]
MKDSDLMPVEVDVKIVATASGSAWSDVLRKLWSDHGFADELEAKACFALATDTGTIHMYSTGAMRIVLRGTTAEIPEWLDHILERVRTAAPEDWGPLLRPVNVTTTHTGRGGATLGSRVISGLVDAGLLPPTMDAGQEMHVITFSS